MINSFKNLIQENSDTLIDESVEREILDVVAVDIFSDRWVSITKNPFNNVKEFLLENFNNDLINPILKEKRFSKKYKNLNKARKLRWNTKTDKHSENGDIRIISTYDPKSKYVYLLLCYKKNKQEDLTENQAKVINEYIEFLRK